MLTRADFPEGFLFGAATSSYQIEGHAEGGAGRTHWDDFAATPGNVVRAEDGALACDHYSRWEEDLDLVANLVGDQPARAPEVAHESVPSARSR